ncbi:MAG: hypothetical protein ACTSRS_13580 [Candidatus Helarchaeota archaeon]
MGKSPELSLNNAQKNPLGSPEHINPESSHTQSLLHPDITNSYFNCCGNPNIIEYQGEFICKSCAVVHEPALRENFTNDIQSQHTELVENNNFHNYGARTTFSIENLPSNQRLLFHRLSKLNSYFRSAIEANKKEANLYLLRIASQLQIPKSIFQHTLRIYSKVLSARLTTGRSIHKLMVASLYLACRLNNFSCHIEDLSKVTQIPVKILRKNYHLIAEKFNLKLNHFTASYYLSQFINNLSLSSQFFAAATKVLKLVENLPEKPGSNPRALAAAIIYLTFKILIPTEPVSQRALAQVSTISEVTIRKYIKRLKQYIIPQKSHDII